MVSTKINWGSAFGDNPGVLSRKSSLRCIALTIVVNNGGLSRKHLVEGINASLKRLQLDYGNLWPSDWLDSKLTRAVDLIYAHRPDRNTPIEETVRAFNHIIDTGKAFYWGTSEWNPEEIATAWGIANRLNMIGPVMLLSPRSGLEG